MARKPKALKSRSAKSAAKTGELERIIAAAMDEAAAVGWAHLSFEAVAARAKLTLGQVLLHTPTKGHLLARFADEIDRTALSSVASIDHTQTVKDRLFDLLMRRFDALQAYRPGVLAVMTGLQRDPPTAAMLLARLSRSMSATLAAAGVACNGLMGLGQMMGLKAVYLSALRAWRTDDSTDMARTMAALDKALGFAERAASFAAGRGKRKDSDSTTAES
ncbi:MAG: hypothetical protein JNK21_05015 [Rhodospirillaceae bacterium]|nr:hypothetical protein [Rhodospirillaceae bacterium]